MISRERVDGELLGAAIRALPSTIYRQTPHWVAVRDEVLRRREGTCSICAAGAPLSLHFRGLENHGFQHTEEGMRAILCFCERCKNTHFSRPAHPQN